MCAAGRSSKKLLKLREDGEVLNGAKDQAVPAEADLEAQTVQSGTKKGMILPFIRLAITFRDIHYYVPMPEVRHVILPRAPFQFALPSALPHLYASCADQVIPVGDMSVLLQQIV